MKQTIAIDFDGVIHKYSNGWQDGSCYDCAIEGAIDALRKLLDRGYKIVIFSTRADTEERISEMRHWLKKYGLSRNYEYEITNKKPIAIAYIDDRGIRFTNWKDMLNYFGGS